MSSKSGGVTHDISEVREVFTPATVPVPEDELVFDFTVSKDDVVTVSMEIYPVEQEGRVIPKVLPRKQVEDQQKSLEGIYAKAEERLAKVLESKPESDEADQLRKDLEMLEEGLRMCGDLLSRRTSTISATFLRPSWTLEKAIERNSTIEVESGKFVWDVGANVNAKMTHLLQSWTLKERSKTNPKVLVPVSVGNFANVHPNIINGFLSLYEQRLDSVESDARKN